MIHCCFQIYTLEETASVLVSLASVFSQVGTLLLTTVVRASEATGNGIGFQTLNQPKGRKDTQQVSKHLPPADSLDCRGSLCFDLCLPTFFFHLVVSSEACSAASHRTIRQQFVHAQNFRVRTVLAPAVGPYEVFCGSNRSTILCTLNRKAVTWEGFLGQSFGRKRGTQIVV